MSPMKTARPTTAPNWAAGSSGSQNLVILAYASASGQTMLRQALESGDFTTFVGGDGMVGDDLLHRYRRRCRRRHDRHPRRRLRRRVCRPLQRAGTDAGIVADAIYAPQAYDAAFLLALAIEKNGSADREGLSAALREVASAPGEMILPGEWEKAKELIAAGTDIDYEGAGGALDFDEAGDVDGIIVELTVDDGAFTEVGVIE